MRPNWSLKLQSPSVEFLNDGWFLMTRKRWTDTRLQKLFEYYNRRFWNGKLPRFTVIRVSDQEYKVYISFKEKLIRVSTNGRSDRDIRSTVLHEMAHLATRRPGHDSKFFEQLEDLDVSSVG